MINPIRFSGLASGMDTEALVKKLMTAERIPYNKLNQKKQLLEWRQDSYREMNALLLSFRDQVFNMGLQSNLLNKQVVSSNEAKATATAGASAGNIALTIGKATLATAATKLSSAGISSNGNKIDANKSLLRQSNAGLFDEAINWELKSKTDEINVVVDSKSFRLSKGEITEGSESIAVLDKDGNVVSFDLLFDETDFKNQNVADPDTLRAYLNRETGTLVFNQNLEKGTKIEASYGYHSFTFNIKTYTEGGNEVNTAIEVDGHDSLNTVLTKLNNSKAGVSAFYDTSQDKVSITRKETGKFGPVSSDEIVTKDVNGNNDHFLFNVLKLNTADTIKGSNAKVEINGLETERTSNTFTINGVTITLKENIDASAPVRINVSNDIEKNIETIKNFVNKYNEMIEKINSKLTEPRYRKFMPLSQEQKDEMKDREIELWEEKAKSGLLNGDTLLSSALGSYRTILYSKVEGIDDKFNSLYSIGIKTGDYSERGKLHIDEKKLREALSENPDAVMKLFTNSSEKAEEKGIAHRLYDSLNKTMKDLTNKAGSTASFSRVDNSLIGKELKDLGKRMDDFQNRLLQIESRYWRQFTAMEQAIQKANAQSGWLMQQFGGGQY